MVEMGYDGEIVLEMDIKMLKFWRMESRNFQSQVDFSNELNSHISSQFSLNRVLMRFRDW